MHNLRELLVDIEASLVVVNGSANVTVFVSGGGRFPITQHFHEVNERHVFHAIGPVPWVMAVLDVGLS